MPPDAEWLIPWALPYQDAAATAAIVLHYVQQRLPRTAGATNKSTAPCRDILAAADSNIYARLVLATAVVVAAAAAILAAAANSTSLVPRYHDTYFSARGTRSGACRSAGAQYQCRQYRDARSRLMCRAAASTPCTTPCTMQTPAARLDVTVTSPAEPSRRVFEPHQRAASRRPRVVICTLSNTCAPASADQHHSSRQPETHSRASSPRTHAHALGIQSHAAGIGLRIRMRTSPACRFPTSRRLSTSGACHAAADLLTCVCCAPPARM